MEYAISITFDKEAFEAKELPYVIKTISKTPNSSFKYTLDPGVQIYRTKTKQEALDYANHYSETHNVHMFDFTSQHFLVFTETCNNGMCFPKTIGEVLKEVEQVLKYLDYNNYDYIGCSHGVDPQDFFPSHYWLACYVVSGNNEGHYIHVDVFIKNPATKQMSHRFLYRIKTFAGMEYAYRLAHVLAEMLQA